MNLNEQATQPLETEYRTIPLTQGQFAIVDKDVYEDVSPFQWAAWWNPCTSSYYAVRHGLAGKTIYMHRFIMGEPKGFLVDHENHDTLDNRKRNLRSATRTQNMFNQRRSSANTSGFKGVSWIKEKGSWRAVVRYNKKTFFLGYHSTAESAHAAYCKKAAELDGDFFFAG